MSDTLIQDKPQTQEPTSATAVEEPSPAEAAAAEAGAPAEEAAAAEPAPASEPMTRSRS